MCGHTDPVRGGGGCARFGWAKERDAMSASLRDLGLYSGMEDVCHLTGSISGGQKGEITFSIGSGV